MLNRQKLAPLIRMLGSPNDSEVIATARAIQRILKSTGADIKDPTDEQVLRIYARENNTQRGEDNSAQAGPIASAIRVAARAMRRATHTGNLSAGTQISKGVGAPTIAKLLGYSRDEVVVVIQLANLKASGDYTRILEEVAAEMGDSAPEDLKKEVARAKVRNPRVFDAQGVQKIREVLDVDRVDQEKVGPLCSRLEIRRENDVGGRLQPILRHPGACNSVRRAREVPIVWSGGTAMVSRRALTDKHMTYEIIEDRLASMIERGEIDDIVDDADRQVIIASLRAAAKTKVGSILFRDHVEIGKCTHAICVCAAHFHDPEGCVNFIPKKSEPKNSEHLQLLSDRLVAVCDEWLDKYARGIRFIDRAELMAKVAQEVGPAELSGR